MERLIIRVDASTQIGTGHLMRCLALAQGWKDAGGNVVFITACQSEGLLQRFREEEFDIHILAHPYPHPGDWDNTKDILSAHPNARVVLDGYHFDESYQQRVKEAGHQLLVIDDMAHLKHYCADIVLNQNLGAEQLGYSCESYTRLLLGTRYALLRREFLAWRGWKREIPEIARHVLVTLGGGDPENYTLKVVQALQEVDVSGLEATVVIGASNPHADVLEARVKRSTIPIRLVRHANNMPELMGWADIAVSSASSTFWELAFMGVPSLVFMLADNQRYVADALGKLGLAIVLSGQDNPSPAQVAQAVTRLLKGTEVRAEMRRNAQQLVNGKGAQRVITSAKESKASGLRLRQAKQEDCRLLWEWANDPIVRAVSFSTEAISWEDHVRWFRAKLSDPSCYHYILVKGEDIPVGQVRFDTSGSEAESDISIASNFRGSGYGANGIRIASKRLFKETAVTRIYAYIKPSNNASIRVFRKAGYKMAGIKVVKGHKAVEMIWEQES